MPTPLADLIESDEFVRRHIGPENADVDHMLQTIGASSIDALLDETMPDTIRSDRRCLRGAQRHRRSGPGRGPQLIDSALIDQARYLLALGAVLTLPPALVYWLLATLLIPRFFPFF